MFKQLRHLENLHIVFWLIKDACWVTQFKTGGVAMVIPTIVMAVYIAFKTRSDAHSFLPNLAVCCWIGANGIWMLGEFFDFNHIPFALGLFFSGIVCMAYYFIRYYRFRNDETHS